MKILALLLVCVVFTQGSPMNNLGLLDLLKGTAPPKPVVRMFTSMPGGNSTYNPSNWYPSSSSNPPDDWYDHESESLEEAFIFPGSHYLERLIMRHLEYSPEDQMEVGDIIDYFDFPECNTKEVIPMISKMYKMLDFDPETVAVMATRILIKPILMQRMKCPAAILDTSIVKSLMNIRYDLIRTEDDSLYSFFTTMAPLIDPMLQPYTHDIAEKGVHEFHGAIFNDTVGYLMGFGLKDVAYSSHRLYSDLVDYFRYMPMHSPYGAMDIKHTIQNALWEIRCPDSFEVINNHQRAVRRFIQTYDMIETDRICPRVIDFLYGYVNMTMPWHMPNFEASTHVEMLCERLRMVIKGFVEGYTKYETALYSMSIHQLEDVLKDALNPDEWELLEEALRRLQFYNMSIK